MADEVHNEVITSDTTKPSRRFKVGRGALLTAAGVAILLIGSYGAWLTGQNGSSKTNKGSSTADQQIKLPHEEVVGHDAQTKALNGDYAGAQKLLDTNIKSADSAQEKSSLYQYKSSISLNEAKYQEGLEAAQQAEKAQPTANTAYLIAINAEGLGNKALALSYYQKSIDRTEEVTKNRAPDIIEMYKQKIQELNQ